MEFKVGMVCVSKGVCENVDEVVSFEVVIVELE